MPGFGIAIAWGKKNSNPVPTHNVETWQAKLNNPQCYTNLGEGLTAVENVWDSVKEYLCESFLPAEISIC